MADESTNTGQGAQDGADAAEAQEATGSINENPQDGTTEAQAAEDGGTTEGEGSDDELKKARREAQNLRRRLRELEGKAQEAENAKLSDLERATKEAEKWRGDYEQLEGSLKAERIISRANVEAGKVGAIEPGAIAKLIPADQVEWDDDRNPANIAELVAAIKKDHPRLFSASPGNGNGGNRDARRSADPGKGVDRLRSAYSNKT